MGGRRGAFFRLFGGNWGCPVPAGHGPLRAGARLFGRGCSAWPGDLPQRIAPAGGIVAAGLGHVEEAALESDDGDGGVGEAGQVAGEVPAADAQAVFVAGEVADVAQSVLDCPMAAVEGGQFLRAGPLRPRGGKAEDGLDGGFPGADDLPLAHDAEDLAVSRQGGQFVREAV